jgi:hypothetical protein
MRGEWKIEKLRNSKSISGVFMKKKKKRKKEKAIRSVCYTRVHIKAVNGDVSSL